MFCLLGGAGVGATDFSALGVFPATELYPVSLHLNRREGLKTLPLFTESLERGKNTQWGHPASLGIFRDSAGWNKS